jgi:bifunctional non-homologous end joining protein LigD
MHAVKCVTIYSVSRSSPLLPAFIEPMAARAVAHLPEGADWLYELKLDGYRALLRKSGAQIHILSRKDNDLTASYPSVAAAALQLRPKRLLIDGEIVAIDASGRPSFQALQHRSRHRAQIVYYAFDLLHLDDSDLTRRPLEQRRAQLARVLGESGILMSQELPGTAQQVIAAVRAAELEGVVAKRRGSVYAPGERSGHWVKLKLDRQQEFVIGGYRPSGSSVDALLVGYYERGQLRFAAKVKAGFTVYMRAELFKCLRRLQQPQCPFSDLPTGRSRWGGGVTAEEMHEMRWVAPSTVAQVRFVEWTAEGRLRHASYLGLRSDKDPREVVREGLAS